MYRRIRRFALATALAIAAGSAAAQQAAYTLEDHWAKLPDGRTWGSTSAVDVDRNGHVWVFERCGANTCAGSSLAPVLEFDQSGRLLRSFGAGMFVFPHSIHVDRDNNVWVVDAQGKDGKGHVVVKFSPEGKVLLTLGKPGVTGDGPDVFNQPVAVVTAPDGEIFVADGHGGDSNARIVRFTKDGRFVKTWGRKGKGPGEFDGLHGISMDSAGRVFVADRSNSRIQVFDQDGRFLAEWKQFGRPSGMYIDAKDTMYVVDHQSDSKINPGMMRGLRIGSVKDGIVRTYVPGRGTDPEKLSMPEGVAADANGNVYGAEVAQKSVMRYTKK
jgi:hypothetical protein